jgi:hypothetical protein
VSLNGLLVLLLLVSVVLRFFGVRERGLLVWVDAAQRQYHKSLYLQVSLVSKFCVHKSFWAYRIRIHHYLYGSFHYQAQKFRKT